MLLALLFNPLAVLARLVAALLERLAPQSRGRSGIPSMGDVLAFEEDPPRRAP